MKTTLLVASAIAGLATAGFAIDQNPTFAAVAKASATARAAAVVPQPADIEGGGASGERLEHDGEELRVFYDSVRKALAAVPWIALPDAPTWRHETPRKEGPQSAGNQGPAAQALADVAGEIWNPLRGWFGKLPPQSREPGSDS